MMVRNASDRRPEDMKAALAFSSPKTGEKEVSFSAKSSESSAIIQPEHRAEENLFDASEFRPRWWPAGPME